MLYFAYGSNMSPRRLGARLGTVRVLEVVSLPEHCLKFHKVGQDGSGKCDAWFSGDQADQVMGVLYDIPDPAIAQLDLIEGVGNGYVAMQKKVQSISGKHYVAHTYMATQTAPDLRPFCWYKSHVLFGAVEHNLPAEYIERIASVVAIEDANSVRVQRELAIYHSGG